MKVQSDLGVVIGCLAVHNVVDSALKQDTMQEPVHHARKNITTQQVLGATVLTVVSYRNLCVRCKDASAGNADAGLKILRTEYHQALMVFGRNSHAFLVLPIYTQLRL
jgi:hypothetical protein